MYNFQLNLQLAIKRYNMNRFNKILVFLSMAFLFAMFSFTQQSCTRGYGCETEEYAKRDINEQLEKSKKGKSNLFPKRMRKKMRK